MNARLEEIRAAIKNGKDEQARIMNAIVDALPEDVYYHNVHIALARLIVMLVESRIDTEFTAAQKESETK